MDLRACMKLFHLGWHHKTYQGHLKMFVRACESTTTASEAMSVAVVKELYTDFMNPIGSINVVLDGSWMTQGRSSHIGIGCIIDLYTGLVIDHIAYSNFCLGCALGRNPEDEGCSDWYASHDCQRNIECNAGRREAEAALTMFQRSVA